MTHGAGKGSNIASADMRRDSVSLFLFTPRQSLRDLDCRSQPSPHFNIQTMPHCSRQIYRDRRVIKLSFSLTVHSQQALRTPTKSHTHTLPPASLESTGSGIRNWKRNPGLGSGGSQNSHHQICLQSCNPRII